MEAVELERRKRQEKAPALEEEQGAGAPQTDTGLTLPAHSSRAVQRPVQEPTSQSLSFLIHKAGTWAPLQGY